LTNTIGPGMRIKDARQTFLGVWLRCLVEGRPFEVWGGRQVRDFTYVDDAVEAFLLAAISPGAAGRVFNLGGCERIDLRGLADLLVEVNGGGRYVTRSYPAERRQIDIGDFYADGGLIERTLGWRPHTRLRPALTRTLAYYRRELRHYL
ncbi:MAG: NAD-dependent epimerase/dehydratase family protein, partial [Opitutaceae bacterium]